jgi:hypothetical protein
MTIKEHSIRDYISKIDFRTDDWKISVIKEDLRRFLGEEPGIDVIYKKDVMISEFTGEAKEFKEIDKFCIVFTDTDDRIRKLEFLIGQNL